MVTMYFKEAVIVDGFILDGDAESFWMVVQSFGIVKLAIRLVLCLMNKC